MDIFIHGVMYMRIADGGFAELLLAVVAVLLPRVDVQKMSTLILVICSLPSMIFFWFVSKYRGGRFFFTFALADTRILWLMCLTSIVDFFLGNIYVVMAVSRIIICPLMAWLIYKFMRPRLLRGINQGEKGLGHFCCNRLRLLSGALLCPSPRQA